MKSFVKILALAVVLNAGALMTPQKVSAQGTDVSFQLFYDQLSPYGSWVDYPNYGYVWIPDVDRDFSPYNTNGHWVFTDDGWTWVSDYPWGWAPFHYGRWAYDDSYGWFWVPHNEWGPAWVTWRRSEGYYGWAPMGPGISVEVSLGRGYRVPNDRWTFVSDRDISRPDIDRHYVDRSTNVTIINRSTVINNTYIDNSRHTKYAAGPARDDVQKVTGAAVRPVAIRDNDKPGQTLSNDQLQIYRPQVQAGNSKDHRPVPSKVVSLKEVKPVSGRTPGNQPQNEKLPANDKAQPPQRQSANPAGNKAAEKQTRVVNPPDRNKSIAQPSQPQTVKPSVQKVRSQQPRVINPPDKNKTIAQPSQPQTVKPIVQKAKNQQPRVINPPQKNKIINQQSKPKNVRSPNTKRQSPPTAPPPNKKDKAPDSQSPKPDKQREDGSRPSHRQTELSQSPKNEKQYLFISII